MTLGDAVEMRCALASDQSLDAWVGAVPSVPAAVELAGYAVETGNDREQFINMFGAGVTNSLQFNAAMDVMQQRSVGLASNVGDAAFELRKVTSLDTGDVPWHGFLERFSAALVARGFDRKYARALAMSLHEIADNVVQHAHENYKTPPSVAAWHAAAGSASFVVLDLGRGIRRSLAQNPRWHSLATDRAALRAVLREHATSRIGQARGGGFNDVVRNFVERNGVIRVRSGNCDVMASGTLTEARELYLPVPPSTGCRVSAWCMPYNNTRLEEP